MSRKEEKTGMLGKVWKYNVTEKWSKPTEHRRRKMSFRNVASGRANYLRVYNYDHVIGSI